MSGDYWYAWWGKWTLTRSFPFAKIDCWATFLQTTKEVFDQEVNYLNLALNGGERTNVRPVTEALFILTGSKVIFFSWHWPVVLLLNTSESALLEILNHYWIEQLSKIWNIFSLLHWLCKKSLGYWKRLHNSWNENISAV